MLKPRGIWGVAFVFTALFACGIGQVAVWKIRGNASSTKNRQWTTTKKIKSVACSVIFPVGFSPMLSQTRATLNSFVGKQIAVRSARSANCKLEVSQMRKYMDLVGACRELVARICRRAIERKKHALSISPVDMPTVELTR